MIADFAALVAAITYIELDVAVLNRIVGVLLPLVVAVVTKKVATGGLKSTLLVALSIASGLATTAIAADGRIPIEELIDASFNVLVTAAAAYYGVLKPTGIAGYVTEKTANIGFGTPPAPSFQTAEKGAEDVGEAIAEAAIDATPPPPAAPAKKASAKKAAKKPAAKQGP